MGTTFRYVADGALAPCGGDQCHHCERTDAPIYSYSGRITPKGFYTTPSG